ncbi:hypothetical protein ACM66B_001519 [Microbotryomycetes sp. NB124-2]
MTTTRLLTDDRLRFKGCVLCQSAQDVLATPNRASKPTNEKHPRLENDQTDFVLGSDDEDEASEMTNAARLPSPSPPPASLVDQPPPAYDEHAIPAQVASHHLDKDEKVRGQQDKLSVHYINPDETLLGLSLQYRVDGRYLCQLNKLHPSALTTSPQLLHTLPFLLLPPSVDSKSSEPLLSAEQERRRLVIRRFQVHTRCSDYAMAAAYCNAIFDAREREAQLVKRNRLARGDVTCAQEVTVRVGGELEEAVEQYQFDDKWEKEQHGKMGSRIKSTGSVEREVKSWSRPR